MKKTTLKRQISGSAIPQNSESVLAKSVVQIWTASCQQSYLTPWIVKPVRNCTGTGFIVDSHKRYIITNEHVIHDHVSVHVRVYGAYERVAAEVLYVSEELDLALLTVHKDSFWDAVNGVTTHFATHIPQQFDPTLVIGYPLGGSTISMTKGVVSRIDCKPYNSMHELPASMLIIQIDAAINSGNSGGPVFDQNGRVVGVAFSGLQKSSAEGIGYIIPFTVVQLFLKAYETGSGHFPGVCSPGFTWQSAENPAIRKLLAMEKTSGIMITDVDKNSCAFGHLKVNDVVLAVDGHVLGFDGTYRFRGDDRLMFKHIISSKHVNEPITYEILRDGKKIKIVHKTGPSKPSIGLFHNRDVVPEYYLCGGIVFIPMSLPLIRELGGINQKLASQLYNRRVRGDLDNEIIVACKFLPHDVNFGYTAPAVPLQSLNGVSVKSMKHLVHLVEKAYASSEQQKYLDFTFGQFESLSRVVFDTKICISSNTEIMKRYQVPRRISPGLEKSLDIKIKPLELSSS